MFYAYIGYSFTCEYDNVPLFAARFITSEDRGSTTYRKRAKNIFARCSVVTDRQLMAVVINNFVS